MPSEWEVQFAIAQQRPGQRLRRQDLHGLFARLLGHGDHDLPAWSLGAWKQGKSSLRVAVRFRDDGLADKLEGALAAVNGMEQIGAYNQVVPMRWTEPAGGRSSYVRSLKNRAWADLRAAPPRTSWTMEFLTLTFFGGTKEPNVLLDPYRVLNSLYRQWIRFDPHSAPDFSKIDRSNWSVPYASLSPRREQLKTEERKYATDVGDERKRHVEVQAQGVTGICSFRHRTPSADLGQSIGALLAFAPFCGVGSSTAYGFGRVVVRDFERFPSVGELSRRHTLHIPS